MKEIKSTFTYNNQTFDYSIYFVEDKFFPYFKTLNIYLKEVHICLMENLSLNDYLNHSFAKTFSLQELDFNVSKLFQKTCFVTDILDFISTQDTSYLDNIEHQLSENFSFDIQWAFSLNPNITKEFCDLVPQNYHYTKALSYYLSVDSLENLDYIDEHMFEYMFKIKHISSLLIEENRKNTENRIHSFFKNISQEKFKGDLKKLNFSYFVSFKMTNIILAYLKKSIQRDLYEFEFLLKSGNKDIHSILIELNQFSPFTYKEFKSIFTLLNNFDFLYDQKNAIEFLIQNKEYLFKIIYSPLLIAHLPDNLVLDLLIEDIFSKKPKTSLSSFTKFIFEYKHFISIDYCKKLSKFLNYKYEENPFLVILFKNNFYNQEQEELISIFNVDKKNFEYHININQKIYEEKLFKHILKDF